MENEIAAQADGWRPKNHCKITRNFLRWSGLPIASISPNK